METIVDITDLDMMEHIDHTWEMYTEGNRVYLQCDCGDIITSCDIPYWYHKVDGKWTTDEEED